MTRMQIISIVRSNPNAVNPTFTMRSIRQALNYGVTIHNVRRIVRSMVATGQLVVVGTSHKTWILAVGQLEVA